MRNRSVRILSSIAVLMASGSAVADIIRVDQNSPTNGAGDLEDWSNARHSLATAIGLANSGDEVWVADGTYKPTTDTDQTIAFEMKAGVQILGGWAGESAPLAARNPSVYITILSGDLSNNDTVGSFSSNRSDNSYHVVKVDGVTLTASAILDGFIIKGGFGGVDVGEDPEREGGGAYLKNAGSPRIVNCLFTDNTARKGGGMYVEGCTPTIRSCDFVANLGGPSIENVLFNGAGGGLYIKHCSPIVVDCHFIDNVAGQTHPSGLNAGIGGGIQVIDDGAPRIFNCEFIRNRCGHVGGGINIREGDEDLETLVVNCIFIANYARDSGGGCRVGLEGRSRFVQCTFVENYCSADGDITHQGSGGGMSIGRGQDVTVRAAYIDNCIFWNNRIYDPQGHGSQIALVGEYSGTATINSCDIQDSDTSEPGIWVQSGWTPPSMTGVVDVDPDFVQDPNPGSDGWGNSNDDFGDLRLSTFSSIINWGNCGLVPLDNGDVDDDGNEIPPPPAPQQIETLPLDLAMAPRRVDRVEMGAYEYQEAVHECQGDINDDQEIGVADLLAVIIAWGPCPAFPSTCPADIGPYPCTDGAIGVADLLAVIAHWGDCTSYTTMPRTVGECMDACAPLGIGSPEYADCVEKCVLSLEQ